MMLLDVEQGRDVMMKLVKIQTPEMKTKEGVGQNAVDESDVVISIFDTKMCELKEKLTQTKNIGLSEITDAACRVGDIEQAMQFLHFLNANLETVAFEREDVSFDEFFDGFVSQLYGEKQMGWPELPKNATDLGLLLSVFYISILRS